METAIRLSAGAALPFVLLWLAFELRKPAVDKKPRKVVWVLLGVAILLALAAVIGGIVEDQKAKATVRKTQAVTEARKRRVTELAKMLRLRIEVGESMKGAMSNDPAFNDPERCHGENVLGPYARRINQWKDQINACPAPAGGCARRGNGLLPAAPQEHPQAGRLSDQAARRG